MNQEIPENELCAAKMLANLPVLTRDGGKRLGKVSGVYVDRSGQSLSTLTYRKRPLGKEYIIKVEDLISIGNDVVFIRDNFEEAEHNEDRKPSGTAIEKFRGNWVTSADGEHIGLFEDFLLRRRDAAISGIKMVAGNVVPLNEKNWNVVIGRDEVLVPRDAVLKAAPTSVSERIGRFSFKMYQKFGRDLRRTKNRNAPLVNPANRDFDRNKHPDPDIGPVP